MAQHVRMSPSTSPPRRTQAERRAETQDRLYTATVELLAESGYAAMTLNAVVKRAGVSPGALWRYCKTKAELAHAAVQYAEEQHRAQGAASLTTEERADAQALTDLLLRQSTGGLAKARLELLRAAPGDEQLRERIAQGSWSQYLGWAESFADLTGAGPLDERDAAMVRVLSLAASGLQVFFRDEDIAEVLRGDIALLARETVEHTTRVKR